MVELDEMHGKVKEIYVEVKKSKNFQTYTAGILVEFDEKNDLNSVFAYWQGKCRAKVIEQIKLD